MIHINTIYLKYYNKFEKKTAERIPHPPHIGKSYIPRERSAVLAGI